MTMFRFFDLGIFNVFIFTTLIKNYILIFVNCNFEFTIEIKDNVDILKTISLIKHKIYEIILIKHS